MWYPNRLVQGCLMRQRSWSIPLFTVIWLLVGCEGAEPLNLEVTAVDDSLVGCETLRDSVLFEEQERSCDGIDNDCDGLVDQLLPSEADCSTGALGACAVGRRHCVAAGETCDVPAPTIERLDGIDNDCDGEVDEDASQVSSSSRVKVWVPPSLWDDGLDGPVSSVAEALDQSGLAYELSTRSEEELTAATLSRFAVVVLPGYVAGSSVPPGSLAALTEWVAAGGRLVLTRLVGEGGGEERSMFRLAGVTSATHRTAGSAVVLQQDSSFDRLESYEERRVPLASSEPLDIYTYELEAGSGAVSLARLFGVSGTDDGAAIVAHPVGKGRVFTLGYNLLDVPSVRCYVNCFEPGRDRMVVWLRSLVEEATGGHAVYKHTVPGLEPSVMIASHDVDAPDAHNDGASWGRAGAIQMLEMEMQEGSPASWFIQTDYKRGIFNPTTIGTIAAAGMTSMGGHTNLHLPWALMPVGDCPVTQSNYDIDSPTVCGEIDVNLALVRQAAPQATGNIWRSPLLSLSPFQYPILAEQGVKYDSSLGMGDVAGNFPIIGERSANFAWLFQGARIVSIPVQAEDGMGFNDADGVERRVELQPATLRRMLLGWTTLLQENAANGAPTLLLVHPSRGQGVGPKNLPVKIDATRLMIRRAKALGVRLSTVNELGDFWRGRDSVAMEASYAPESGYLVRLSVGEDAAPNFSLVFSESIVQAACESADGVCPVLRSTGSKLMFYGVLEPNRHYDVRVLPGVLP